VLDDENGCPEESLRLRARLDVEDVAVLPSGSRFVRFAAPAPAR
jgi:hypothetical protein